MPVLDGMASLCIAAVLAATALLLARETEALLNREPASQEAGDFIRAVAEQDQGVRHVNGLWSVQMGPVQVDAALSVEFDNTRTTPQIEACIDRMERQIKSEHPLLQVLFVKSQTPQAWHERVRLQQTDSGSQPSFQEGVAAILRTTRGEREVSSASNALGLLR